MKENLKIKENGITLIALVVTIVVLLILASISIATLTGDNGIIDNATKTKENANKKTLKDEIETVLIDADLNDPDDIKEKLEKNFDVTESKNDDGSFVVTKYNVEVTVSKDGIIQEKNTQN